MPDDEKTEEIRKIIKAELRVELEAYFNESLFMLSVEQHYKDHQRIAETIEHREEWKANHEWTSGVREDIKDVKRGFFRKLGTVLALFLAGGISFKYLLTYITSTAP